jgi:hypothetical protein
VRGGRRRCGGQGYTGFQQPKEVTVNAIMPFSIIALIWVVLTVGAAILGGISHLFSGH